MSNAYTTTARSIEELRRLSEAHADRLYGCTLLDARQLESDPGLFLPGAARLAVEGQTPEKNELASHMMGRPGSEILVCAENSDKARACAAELSARGWLAGFLDAPLPADALRSGRPKHALWRPDPYVEQHALTLNPGSAIDLGAGNGRDAVFLAQLGHDCLIVDRYEDALELAVTRARLHEVPLRTLCTNLRDEASVPTDMFDLALSIRFLHRPLLASLHERIPAGGHIIFRSFGLDPSRAVPKNMRVHHRLSEDEIPLLLKDEQWEFLDGPTLSWQGEECWIQFFARRRPA